MGLVETQAIVLQTYKLADADKIVLCMTEKSGLVRGVARGARRLKSKFGASLEPFTLINLTRPPAAPKPFKDSYTFSNS
jgi:DNA repair protein RecO (recombination protein O)